MTFAELGSMGELIGAFAVVVTLVYLASQTRQARVAAEETAKYAGLQATHSMLDLYFDWRNTLFSNPQHIEIIAKANAGQELSDAEKFALGLLFHDLFFAAAYSYMSASTGGSIHEQETDVEYIVLFLQENPCAIAEWHRVRTMVESMNTDFVSLVNSRIDVQ